MAKNKEVKFSTPRFYEMDGALRAYANRSIVVATVSWGWLRSSPSPAFCS